jgi:hypothetical protein
MTIFSFILICWILAIQVPIKDTNVRDVTSCSLVEFQQISESRTAFIFQFEKRF